MSDDTKSNDTPPTDQVADGETEEALDHEVVEEDSDVETVEPEPEPDPNAVTVSINGEPVAARKGEMVIAAALRNDDYIPHFCYHPRMDPVGMCRQCMVEVEGPRGPMMVVSCMTPVADGQVVRDRHPAGQARPGGHARTAARQPPARLPGLRQGRRVPAAGPGVQPRSRREPVRRAEAPLRKADPHQRPRLPRP